MLISLAGVHERLGQPSEAENAYRRALSLASRFSLHHAMESSSRPPVIDSCGHLAGLLISQKRPADAAAMLVSLMEELRELEQDTFSEWRAAVAGTSRETMAALPRAEALRLAESTRAFLMAPGDTHLTTAEIANLAALERSVAE